MKIIERKMKMNKETRAYLLDRKLWHNITKVIEQHLENELATERQVLQTLINMHETRSLHNRIKNKK